MNGYNGFAKNAEFEEENVMCAYMINLICVKYVLFFLMYLVGNCVFKNKRF